MRNNRRQFLIACAALAASPSLRPGAAATAALADAAADIRITRVVGFELRCRRDKFIGRNAYREPHGDRASEPAVRIYTDKPGVEGLGFCNAPKDKLAELLGNSAMTLLDRGRRRLRSPVGSQTMALWDLLARAADVPAWAAFGDKVRASSDAPRIPVYDGSIYFTDLLPEYATGWEDRFKREVDMTLALGHRGMKVKVGRGSKWMPRAEGDARDVAVIKLLRAHAGPDVIIGVDANNGYDLAGAKHFIDQTADAKLAFAEEMFPETVEHCLELKAFFKQHKLDTLLADGETQGDLNVFKPFAAAKAIDVYQADMNRFGADGILDEADMVRPSGAKIAPHNWGSLLGYYHQLQVGAAIDNLYAAEQDPMTSDVLVADGFTIKEGHATLPPTSGFGLRINEELFAANNGGAKVTFDLKA